MNENAYEETGINWLDEANQMESELKKNQPELFQAVSQVMFKHDLMEINYETNTDEYDSEAGTVIPRLKDCRSVNDVGDVLFEEFSRWFNKSAGKRHQYNELANDIWLLWQQSKQVNS